MNWVWFVTKVHRLDMWRREKSVFSIVVKILLDPTISFTHFLIPIGCPPIQNIKFVQGLRWQHEGKMNLRETEALWVFRLSGNAHLPHLLVFPYQTDHQEVFTQNFQNAKCMAVKCKKKSWTSFNLTCRSKNTLVKRNKSQEIWDISAKVKDIVLQHVSI